AAFGKPVPSYPIALAFIVDCDGSVEDCISHLVREADAGLRQIFSHCEHFTANTDLLTWMTRQLAPSSASYVNWVGRTVRQVREEAVLREFLLRSIGNAGIKTAPAQDIYKELAARVREARDADTLVLTPPQATPVAWRLQNWIHCLSLPLGILAVVIL